MTHDSYVHIFPSGAETSEVGLSEVKLLAEVWYCSSCHRPKPGTGPVSISILQTQPVNSPLDYVAYSGLHIARREFLSLFGEKNVARDLMLAPVYGSDGAPIAGWVTFRGRHRLIVRGNLKKGFEHYVGSRICKECGNLIYFAYPPNYLFPAPNPEVAIFQSQLGGLIVRADRVAHLDLKRKKGFGIEKLKVLDKPRDGLGVLEAT